ncbi:MAG: DUF58 domain-containing protein [Gammaproteobacteria bacterium]
MHAAWLAPLFRLAGRKPPQRRRTGSAGRAKPVVLLRPRIFILPTRQGMLFSVVLLTMLLGSLNYNNSMGFALTFLLAGIGFIAIAHTYFNLARTQISIGKLAPVFAGTDALFPVILKNPSAHARRALILQIRQQQPVFAHVTANNTVCVPLSQPTGRRGFLPMERLTVSTRFPLGLFCAWSHLSFDARCLVYPTPRGNSELPISTPGNSGQPSPGQGNDDFAGHRNYRAGDSLARVNWKAAARGQGLLIKEFTGVDGGNLWLDWQQFVGSDDETRLSQLCQRVLDADTAGHPFGLRLPGRQISPGAGDAHKHACLAALALFRLPPNS